MPPYSAGIAMWNVWPSVSAHLLGLLDCLSCGLGLDLQLRLLALRQWDLRIDYWMRIYFQSWMWMLECLS